MFTKRNPIHIKWENEYIDPDNYKELIAIISKHDYSLLYGRELVLFHNAANGLQISAQDADSIRAAYLKQKIIKLYPEIKRNTPKYAAEYNVYDILTLSKRYKLPPLTLLRSILSTKYSQRLLRDVFKGALSPSKLSPRDHAEYIVAVQHDAEASFNQARVILFAKQNEIIFTNWLVENGVSLKREDLLIAEQIKEHDRAVITPDILFTEPVYINGIRVHWIDYKDYTCTDIEFLLKSNIAQSQKYNEKWGPGAICYNGAILDSVVISNTLLLSTLHTPIKFLQK